MCFLMSKQLLQIYDVCHAVCKYVFLVNCHFQPMQVKSVLAKEGLRGYIYVEALKQTHVKRLIDGVGNLRMGQWQQTVS